mmetsp:Transcript_104955/g.321531  ORF Transcript_104955/g.321531 Transcript_104955/m.321531 type:complete len:247 (-) Transcript_104955:817-1557(-)
MERGVEIGEGPRDTPRAPPRARRHPHPTRIVFSSARPPLGAGGSRHRGGAPGGERGAAEAAPRGRLRRRGAGRRLPQRLAHVVRDPAPFQRTAPFQGDKVSGAFEHPPRIALCGSRELRFRRRPVHRRCPRARRGPAAPGGRRRRPQAAGASRVAARMLRGRHERRRGFWRADSAHHSCWVFRIHLGAFGRREDLRRGPGLLRTGPHLERGKTLPLPCSWTGRRGHGEAALGVRAAAHRRARRPGV